MSWKVVYFLDKHIKKEKKKELTVHVKRRRLSYLLLIKKRRFPVSSCHETLPDHTW
jgi:hypothetical protein